MIRHSSLVLLLAFAASSWAEGDDKAPPPPAPAPGAKPDPAPAAKPDPEPAAKPATEPAAKPAADAESPVRGARYQITLNTGRSLIGVVTSDSVFERRDGVSWVASDKDVPGAGVRLYFVKDADGFVFVPTKDMKSAEKLEELSDRDGHDLAKRRVAAAHRADEERDHLRKEREKRAAKAKEDEAEQAAVHEEAKAAEHELSAEEQLARYTSLLTKYPPGKWTLDTPKDLERRRIVMDLFPNEEEKAFLAVYDDWAKAYALWKVGHEKEQEQAKEHETMKDHETEPAKPAPAADAPKK